MTESTPISDPFASFRRPVPFWATLLALTALCIAIAGAIGDFHHCVPRAAANESAAIATLKNISSAQSQVLAAGAIDVDRDGCGEYAFLAELAGAAPLRQPARADRWCAIDLRLGQPLLSPRFGRVVDGRIASSGYYFRCFLRGADGRWIGEAQRGGAGGVRIDPDQAEADWLVYAWPIAPGSSGRRTFVIDASGDIRATGRDQVLFGGNDAPAAGQSGFVRDGGQSRAVGNTVDGDGVLWVIVS